MNTLGRHLLAEYYGCESGILNDEKALSQLLARAAKAAGVTVIDSIEHSFSPVGVTCVVAIEESHLSLHTWPEEGYAAADFFTCGEGRPSLAHEILCEGLAASKIEVLLLERGRGGEGQSIKILHHDSQKPPGDS